MLRRFFELGKSSLKIFDSVCEGEIPHGTWAESGVFSYLRHECLKFGVWVFLIEVKRFLAVRG